MPLVLTDFLPFYDIFQIKSKIIAVFSFISNVFCNFVAKWIYLLTKCKKRHNNEYKNDIT